MHELLTAVASLAAERELWACGPQWLQLWALEHPEEQQEARHPGPSSQLERLIWENLCGLSHPGALWSLAGPELLKNFFFFFFVSSGSFSWKETPAGD